MPAWRQTANCRGCLLCAQVGRNWQSPCSAAWLLMLLWTASFKSLLTYIGFTLNLCAAATVVGLIRLKLREGNRLAVVGWPLAQLIFLLGVLWMAWCAIALQPTESLWGLATLGMAWFLWRLGQALRER